MLPVPRQSEMPIDLGLLRLRKASIYGTYPEVLIYEDESAQVGLALEKGATVFGE